MLFKYLGSGNTSKLLKKHLCPLPALGHYVNHDVELGQWSFRRFKLEPCVGYFSDGSDYGRGAALLKGEVTWMSATPMEYESHLIAQYAARGTTVVAGLGLGMIALSLLQKKEVSKLVVLEYDKDLIEGFESLLTGRTLKLWRDALKSKRLELVECDCLKPLSQEVLQKVRGCDFLWVDIWETLHATEGLGITAELQSQIQAKELSYWGAELDILISSGETIRSITADSFQQSALRTGLPLTAAALKGNALQLYMEISAKALELYGKNVRRQVA